MPKNAEVATDEWLNGLEADRLRQALGEVGKLKPAARRKAMADPAAVFEQAGLPPPPEGTSCKIVIPGKNEIDEWPKLEEFDELVEAPLIMCIEVWTWVPWRKRGRIIGMRRIRRLVCFKV